MKWRDVTYHDDVLHCITWNHWHVIIVYKCNFHVSSRAFYLFASLKYITSFTSHHFVPPMSPPGHIIHRPCAKLPAEHSGLQSEAWHSIHKGLGQNEHLKLKLGSLHWFGMVWSSVIAKEWQDIVWRCIKILQNTLRKLDKIWYGSKLDTPIIISWLIRKMTHSQLVRYGRYGKRRPMLWPLAAASRPLHCIFHGTN